MAKDLKHVAGGIKTRDIDSIIRSRGFEPGVKYILGELAEQQRALEQTQIVVAQSLDQMTDIIMQFSEVAGNMKNAHEELTKKLQGTDRPDLPNARGEE